MPRVVVDSVHWVSLKVITKKVPLWFFVEHTWNRTATKPEFSCLGVFVWPSRRDIGVLSRSVGLGIGDWRWAALGGVVRVFEI